MVLLGLAAAELRTCKAVVALEGSRPHRVHAVLTDADNFAQCVAPRLGRGEPTVGC